MVRTRTNTSLTRPRRSAVLAGLPGPQAGASPRVPSAAGNQPAPGETTMLAAKTQPSPGAGRRPGAGHSATETVAPRLTGVLSRLHAASWSRPVGKASGPLLPVPSKVRSGQATRRESVSRTLPLAGRRVRTRSV